MSLNSGASRTAVFRLHVPHYVADTRRVPTPDGAPPGKSNSYEVSCWRATIVAVRDIDGTDSRSAVRRPTRGLICRSPCSPVPVFFQFSDAGSVTVAMSSLRTKNCVKM